MVIYKFTEYVGWLFLAYETKHGFLANKIKLENA